MSETAGGEARLQAVSCDSTSLCLWWVTLLHTRTYTFETDFDSFLIVYPLSHKYRSGLPFGPRSQASLQKAQGPGLCGRPSNRLGMQPWALSLPDKELCLREALAVCTPPAPEPSAKRPGS